MTSWKAALFSAIVGAFIIESYKKLSPDTGSQTVVLLRQISQQLTMNGTSPNPSVDQPFSPSAPILWVNGMWLTSLVLSVTSALYSTLLQEWARTYTQIPQLSMRLSHRARVTSFLFFSLTKYNITFAALTAQGLLHVSVFCFFIGLVIFFFIINKTMAIVVLIPFIIFGLAYFMLTIIRWIDPKCPYHTPITWVLGYPLYIPLSLAARCLRWVVRLVSGHPISYDLGEVTPSGQRQPAESLKICYRAVEDCRQRFKHNLNPVSRLISRAKEATMDVDRKALTQLFDLLSPADESKTSNIVACIPREKMVELVAPSTESGNVVFRQPILTVLQSCADGTRTAGLDEAVRKRSVLACLHAVHHIVRSFVSLDGEPSTQVMSLLGDVRTNFANLGLMQAMWNDTNVSIRVTSRSICALLARWLLHRLSLPRPSLEATELDWLRGVTGLGGPSVAAPDTATLVQMNIKAFVYGALLHHDQQCDLPTEHATCFTETLSILMNAGAQIPFDRTIFQTQLYALIAWIQQDDPEGSGEVVDKLCRMFQDFLHPYATGPGPAIALALARAPALRPGSTPTLGPLPSPGLTPSPGFAPFPGPGPGPAS